MATPTHTTTPMDLSWVEFSSESEETCTTKLKECPNEALWDVIAPCCGAHYELCDPCKDFELKFMESVFAKGNLAGCQACKNTFHYLKVERLKH